MKKEKAYCMEYLDNLRKNWVESNELTDIPRGMNSLHNILVEIEDKPFTESIYSQYNDERVLVVFELSRKALIGSVHYSLGVEKLSGKESSYLSEEELWEEGIP